MRRSRSGGSEGSKPRFAIGEWGGRPFDRMTVSERKAFVANLDAGSQIGCPFRISQVGEPLPCNKPGAVCSFRQYTLLPEGGAKANGSYRVCCPERFKEADIVHRWIAEELLGTSLPLVLNEVKFLKRVMNESLSESDTTSKKEGVGKIDSILVHPDTSTLQWCAVEMQAVYFSGDKMELEFDHVRDHWHSDVPHFPVGKRRPDYRSSGPKRLMPQLQIKVPTLRRWGKKLAVVVDEAWFNEFQAGIKDEPEKSNADVGWFIVRLQESEEGVLLRPHRVVYTTLEAAVIGLTAGVPVTKYEFENKLLDQIRTHKSRIVPELDH